MPSPRHSGSQKSLRHSHSNCHARKPHRRAEPVLLNVYDMLKINEYTTPLGIGVFHTGVEVFGVEYGYAGHTSAESGIFEMMPRDHNELGDQFQFRQTIRMGNTTFTRSEVNEIIRYLGTRFCGNRYHLTTNNCNHFSNALTKMLVGREIPSWVNRLAHIFSHVPLLQRCLPKELLRPILEPSLADMKCSETKSEQEIHAEK